MNLLDYKSDGADVKKLTPKYGSPLQAALEGLATPSLGPPPEFSNFENEDSQNNYSYAYNRRHRTPDGRDLEACEKIIQTLLAHRADANPRARRLGNPLHLAAFVGSEPIVQQLLENGAILDSISKRFGTALFAAIEQDNQNMIIYLLQNGIDIHYVSPEHGTALHYACNRLQVDLVRSLLEFGADPDRVCAPYGSPLDAFLSSNFSWGDGRDRGIGITKVVLNRGNYTVIPEQTLLGAVKRITNKERYVFRSRREKDVPQQLYGEEVTGMLLEHDRNPKATEPVLVAAVQRLDSSGVHILRLLLQRDGGDRVKKTMLVVANNLEIMKLLLEHRPICSITLQIVQEFSENYNARGNLLSSRTNQAFDILRLLIDHDMNMSITPDVISAVLALEDYPSYSPRSPPSQRPQDLIKYLFKRNTDLVVTESVILRAKSATNLKVLLKHAPNFKVTPFVLSDVAGVERSWVTDANRERVVVLLAHDKSTVVPQTLSKTIPSRSWDEKTLEYLTILLDRALDLQLPSDLCWAAYGGGHKDEHEQNRIDKNHLDLFLRHGKTVELGDRVRQALEKDKYDPELKAMWLRLEGVNPDQLGPEG